MEIFFLAMKECVLFLSKDSKISRIQMKGDFSKRVEFNKKTAFMFDQLWMAFDGWCFTKGPKL